MQGVVKVYDPKTGFGVIVTDDDKSEVLLKPGALDGSIFRMLRQGQRVVFDRVEEGDQVLARKVRIGSDGA